MDIWYKYVGNIVISMVYPPFCCFAQFASKNLYHSEICYNIFNSLRTVESSLAKNGYTVDRTAMEVVHICSPDMLVCGWIVYCKQEQE